AVRLPLDQVDLVGAGAADGAGHRGAAHARLALPSPGQGVLGDGCGGRTDEEEGAGEPGGEGAADHEDTSLRMSLAFTMSRSRALFLGWQVVRVRVASLGVLATTLTSFGF